MSGKQSRIVHLRGTSLHLKTSRLLTWSWTFPSAPWSRSRWQTWTSCEPTSSKRTNRLRVSEQGNFQHVPPHHGQISVVVLQLLLLPLCNRAAHQSAKKQHGYDECGEEPELFLPIFFFCWRPADSVMVSFFFSTGNHKDVWWRKAISAVVSKTVRLQPLTLFALLFHLGLQPLVLLSPVNQHPGNSCGEEGWF